MPVDGPSYLVGRTDKRVLTMFCSGTNYQCLWTGPKNSLLKLSTPRIKPLLLDDAEDCNNVHKVFLGVPMGVNVHIDVRIVRKLDLQHLMIFLGRDNIHLMYVRDGRPVAQLPFLALRTLQPIGRPEVGTHFGILPEPGT
jgi:hypothetical protein